MILTNLYSYFILKEKISDLGQKTIKLGQLIQQALLKPLLKDESITIMLIMLPIYYKIRYLAAKAIDRQQHLLKLKLPLQKINCIDFMFPGSYGMLIAYAIEQKGF